MKVIYAITLVLFCSFLTSAQCPNGPCPDRIQRNGGRCIVKSDGSLDCTAAPGRSINLITSGGGVVNVNGVPVSGGGGTPGGADTQIQFNDGGVFGGNANFTFNKASARFSLVGPFELPNGVIESPFLQVIDGAGFGDFKADQIFVDSATPNSPCYVNGLKLLICDPELADGQLLIGDTANAPQAGNITGTAPIVVTNGAGTINISCPTCAVAEEFQFVAAKSQPQPQFAHAFFQCNGPCPDRIQKVTSSGAIARGIANTDGSIAFTAVSTKDITLSTSGAGGDVLIAAPGGSFVGGGTGTIGTGTYVDARSNGIPRSTLYAGDGTADDSFVQAWTFAGSGGYVDIRARSATTTGHIELDASNGPAVVTFTAPGGVKPNADGIVDLGTAAHSFRQVFIDATITAAATTGAQTINKSAGSVNFAAAADSLVVTSDKVTANSVVICTVATNDATLKSVACVAGAGSFTMHANAAATAETRVNFWILNQ